MRNMNPETLASMSAATGVKLSAADAEQMAATMRNMKPEHMAKLVAVGSAIQGLVLRVRAARAWAQRNSLLVAALLVLLLALLLRRWMTRRGASVPAAAPLLDEDVARGATW